MSEAVLDMSSRVTRIAAPVASPGHCALCGKSDHPLGFAATENMEFEFFGTLYFCADCVGDYARVFGYMHRTEISDLIDKQKSMYEELELLRSAVANLENILDAYSRLRPNSGIPDHRHISDAVASADANEGTDQADGEQLSFATADESSDAEHATGTVDSGEGTDDDINESDSKQRRADVSDDSSNVVTLFEELGI